MALLKSIEASKKLFGTEGLNLQHEDLMYLLSEQCSLSTV